MIMVRRAHMKMAGSAVVVLATVVNAAAVEPASLPEKGLPDLSWAVRGGGTHSVKSTKAYFAKKAVTAIDSADQLSSAPLSTVETPCVADLTPAREPSLVRDWQCPARSSHQHSAP
jgi:hypothetical protein